MLALLAATPVFAQSAPPATTTTSTSSTTSSTTTSSTSTTSTTVPATTTTDAPPPAAVPAKTSNPTPQPGENVPISAPQQNNTPVLDNTKPSAAVMLPADGGADIPMPQPKITQNANGSITVEVTVPPNTPPGVYLIAIVGTDSKGVSRAIIVPVVVRRTRTAAALSAPIAAASAPAAVVPKSVRQVVSSIADIDGGSAAVEDAVLHDGATLDISGSQLVVNRPGDDSNDSTRPLVAAFAVVLAGGGLVLLRRRTPATSNGSK